MALTTTAAAIGALTNVFLLLQLFHLHPNNVDGFLLLLPQKKKPIIIHHHYHHHHYHPLSSSLSVTSSSSSSSSLSSSSCSRILLNLQQINDNDNNVDNDDDDDEVFLTPIQIRMIRKDIIRKRANQKLPTIYYNSSNNNNNNKNDETSSSSIDNENNMEQQIMDTLIIHQLVQVRSIGLQYTDTRDIRNDAEQLAYRIQKRIQQQQQQYDNTLSSSSSSTSTSTQQQFAHVFVVEIKGHMATLFYYIPQQQLTTPFRQQYQKTKKSSVVLLPTSLSSNSNSRLQLPKVELRTTGKRNDWKKRPKALRDNAGQIIK